MSEQNKYRCIVLLPPGQHYERLFDEILQPAIIDTGFTPSRLYMHSPIPIDIFVDEIDRAEALFGDLSENTAEIWLAAGSAVALGKPLCLISSGLNDNRPLSIQHLPLIPYPADPFPSDYAELQRSISAQLSVSIPQPEPARREDQPYTQFLPDPSPGPSDELASYEVMALTIISVRAMDSGLSPRDLGLEMQTHASAHLTSHAMNSLKRRGFLERKPVQINQGNEIHISENLFITRDGQDWLLRHGRRATTHRSTTRTREMSLHNR
jgi:hypothetical protein